MSDFHAELEAALRGDDPDFTADPALAGSTLDATQATAWLASVEHIRRQRVELTEAYNEMVRRMKVRLDERLANLDTEEGFFTEALAVYHAMKVAEDQERNKTMTLPTGVLKSGTWGGDKWIVTDEAAYDAWILVNLPGAVTYPEPQIKRGEAKKLLKDARITDGRVQLSDGTVVPGLEIKTAERQYKVMTETEA